MELHQLEYLLAVVDEGGFTRAAARLHVSQPAVSAQVRKLESELGEPLLHRSGGVRLTEVGRDVVPHARAVLAARDAIAAVVDEHRGLIRGRVAIGVIASGLPGDLPDLLASFATAHPDVEISLTEGGGPARLQALLDGRSDVAVLGLVGDPPAGVASVVLLDAPVVVAVATDDELADRTGVTLAELADRALIVLPVGTGLRDGIDRALDAEHHRARIAYEAATPQLACALAARRLGVALVPDDVVPHVDGVVAVPLTSPRLRGRVHLVWPATRSTSPAARALVAHLRRGLAPAHRPGEGGRPDPDHVLG